MQYYRRTHAVRLIEVFNSLPLHLKQIEKEFEKVLRKDGENIPRALGATVRRTLQDNSKECAGHKGDDLFYMPEGKGNGIWALRQENVDAYLEERGLGARRGRGPTDPV